VVAEYVGDADGGVSAADHLYVVGDFRLSRGLVT
jgi:hypothetical protein